MRSPEQASVDLSTLSLTQLALFVGQAADELLLTQLQAAGFTGVKPSHGYVVQHLLAASRSISELAGLLEISQQAVSKSVAELVEGGYVEVVKGEDARVRRVQLSPRGLDCVAQVRRLRRRLDARLSRRVNPRAYREAHAVMLSALDLLGASELVHRRRVRPAR